MVGLGPTGSSDNPDNPIFMFVLEEESLYRRPVEEIGGGSQVSLKMDPEEN